MTSKGATNDWMLLQVEKPVAPIFSSALIEYFAYLCTGPKGRQDVSPGRSDLLLDFVNQQVAKAWVRDRKSKSPRSDP